MKTIQIGELNLSLLSNGAVEISKEVRHRAFSHTSEQTRRDGHRESDISITRLEPGHVTKLREFLNGGAHA